MNTQETAKLTALNSLTREATAFSTWEAFRVAMVSGYVPTIWPRPLKRNATAQAKFFAECQVKLTEMVRAEGFRVFDGVKVH